MDPSHNGNSWSYDQQPRSYDQQPRSYEQPGRFQEQPGQAAPMHSAQYPNSFSQFNTGGTNSAVDSPRRPGSPEDPIQPVPRHNENPFASGTSTPGFFSRPQSVTASSSALNLHQQEMSQRYFHSRRVKKGEVERPWLNKKDPREKWVTIIPLIGLALGFALAGFLVYDGLKSVTFHDYCKVLEDDFSGGLNSKIWTKEAEVGGFGSVLSKECSRLMINIV